jgi:hypothetical protein
MPALTAEQALDMVRIKLEALTGKGECTVTVEALLEAIKPENIVAPYNPLQVKADRYDGIVRWFGNNMRYMMSVGEDEDLGCAIDEKLEEEEEAREARRAAREAAGQ